MHTPVHVIWGVSKHLAAGYLVYAVVQHVRRRSPTSLPVAVLLLGALFPDLIDKPLAAAGVVGYGRSVAHSLFTASALVAAAGFLAGKWSRVDAGVAFGIGYLSHVAVDMYGPVLTGTDAVDTAFLFWPVLVEHSLGVATPELPLSRHAIFAAVVASSFFLWVYDGAPVGSDAVRLARSRFHVGAGGGR